MNRDRIVGAATLTLGKIKQSAGYLLGDAKLVANGKIDARKGKIQNVVGGLRDAFKSAP